MQWIISFLSKNRCQYCMFRKNKTMWNFYSHNKPCFVCRIVEIKNSAGRIIRRSRAYREERVKGIRVLLFKYFY